MEGHRRVQPLPEFLEDPEPVLSPLLTTVLTTSATASDPSTEMIEGVLASFRFVPGLLSAPLLIVCDDCKVGGPADPPKEKKKRKKTKASVPEEREANSVKGKFAETGREGGVQEQDRFKYCYRRALVPGEEGKQAYLEYTRRLVELVSKEAADSFELEYPIQGSVQRQGRGGEGKGREDGEETSNTVGVGGHSSEMIREGTSEFGSHLQSKAEDRPAAAVTFYKSKRFPAGASVLKLEGWHGFALALKAALRFVRTPFVAVVQHDRPFVRPFSLRDLLRVMQTRQEEVKVVNCLNRSMLGHLERVVGRFNLGSKRTCVVGMAGGGSGGLHSKDILVPDFSKRAWDFVRDGLDGIAETGFHLRPLLHFLDSTHFASLEFYRDFVFAPDSQQKWGGTIEKGGFIEDKLGQRQLHELRLAGVLPKGKENERQVRKEEGPKSEQLPETQNSEETREDVMVEISKKLQDAHRRYGTWILSQPALPSEMEKVNDRRSPLSSNRPPLLSMKDEESSVAVAEENPEREVEWTTTIGIESCTIEGSLTDEEKGREALEAANRERGVTVEGDLEEKEKSSREKKSEEETDNSPIHSIEIPTEVPGPSHVPDEHRDGPSRIQGRVETEECIEKKHVSEGETQNDWAQKGILVVHIDGRDSKYMRARMVKIAEGCLVAQS
uniref:Uncharacterized protein n=1 Tax=Chromera velia CCMP2878 TaxID=1169474 RepID=A0A0G4F3L0_9ALVE|eukprot:Cvel_2690.t1-p1 / transcript=Cvel_2690.t1 / gene=Cvel_2690 / organism=Chromera_velia_CCMP2878 / gene_product=hypothetical protein / transcript_product=hypothetical protein / location=Cvel_scaffold107:123061-125064(-) / protein_length=668 / sequence_SO=supercontig / SO=protein_coding / is_pseudo=false